MLGLQGQATTSGDPRANDFGAVGGLFKLSGLPENSLAGKHTGVASAIFYHRFHDTFYRSLLDTPLYLGASVEVGNAWLRDSDVSLDNSIWAGSLFAGMDTLIGPVFVAAGATEDGDTSLYLFVGRAF